MTDDVDPETGLIDGLAPLTEPADGKISIIKAARAYIVHLDLERNKTDRQRRELEEFISKIETGEEALKIWKDAFDAEEKLRQAPHAAPAAEPNAIAGPSGLDSDGHPMQHAAVVPDGIEEAKVEVPSPFGSAGEDTAALALAALAPGFAPSQSMETDESTALATPDRPKKGSRSNDAREKNRVKQRLYRERQKAKMIELESQIHRMESGGTPARSTATPTRQQEQLRALQQEEDQLAGEETLQQQLDLARPSDPTEEDTAAMNERTRLLVQDHLDRVQASHADASETERPEMDDLQTV